MYYNLNAVIDVLNNQQSDINTAAGFILKEEALMRLIAQFSRPVQEEIKFNFEKQSRKKNKKNLNYWECDLEFLSPAVANVFSDLLNIEEKNKIGFFNKFRGRVFHLDLVRLSKEFFNKELKGRQILDVSGRRNLLDPSNIEEQILVSKLKENNVWEKIRLHCCKLDEILRWKILYKFEEKGFKEKYLL